MYLYSRCPETCADAVCSIVGITEKGVCDATHVCASGTSGFRIFE